MQGLFKVGENKKLSRSLILELSVINYSEDKRLLFGIADN